MDSNNQVTIQPQIKGIDEMHLLFSINDFLAARKIPGSLNTVPREALRQMACTSLRRAKRALFKAPFEANEKNDLPCVVLGIIF
jgi:hypothetical protein